MTKDDRPTPEEIVGATGIYNLSLHGYAIFDVALVLAQIENTNSRSAEIAKSVDEKQKSIRQGARRSRGRFSLT